MAWPTLPKYAALSSGLAVSRRKGTGAGNPAPVTLPSDAKARYLFFPVASINAFMKSSGIGNRIVLVFSVAIAVIACR